MYDFNDAPKQFENTEKHQHSLEEIDAAIKGQLRNYVLHLFPNAQINRGQARIGSLLGEPGESLSVALDGADAGQWLDHNTNESGNAIQLWQQCDKLSFGEAVTEIKKWLGFDSAPLKKTKTAAIRQAQPKAEPVQLGQPDIVYDYKDAENKIIAQVKRYNLPDGKKTFRVWDAVASKAQQPNPKPLFNIPSIMNADEVIFVEGEKAALALIELGYNATSLMSGGNSRLDKTDFSPIAGKKCVLWRDNDATGLQWQAGLLSHLNSLGCPVRALKIGPNIPDKGDAADMDADFIHSLISSKRFKLRKAGEVKNTPPPEFLIQDFITESGMASIVGPSGSGKSFVALDMALCISHGIQWHEKPTKAASCVYIAAEGSSGMASRISAFDKEHQVDTDSVDFWLLPNAINLVDPETDMPDLYDSLDDEKPNVIIVDTLARSFAGGDENSAKDMSQFIDNCGKLQERYNCLIIIIHHTGKDLDKGARGSSAFKAALDSEFSVKRIEGTEHLSLITTKQKDCQEAPSMHFRLATIEIVNQVTGEIQYSCVVSEDETIFAGRRQKLTDNQKAILSVLERSKEPLTLAEMIAKTGLPKSSVHRFLSEHSKGASPILVLGSSHSQSHTGEETYALKTTG